MVKYGIACLAFIIFSCSGKGGENKERSHTENVKLEQYMVSGSKLYTIHCSSCHQPEGQGLAKLFPPLNESDYMENNPGLVPCIIKNGLSGEITVNGIVYNQPMPAIPQLTNLEIAEITTFIYNSWGRKHGIINVKEVDQMLEKCKE